MVMSPLLHRPANMSEIVTFISLMFTDIPLVFMLLGIVFCLIGLFSCFVWCFARMKGRLETAVVLGGINHHYTKEKIRDGETVTKNKTMHCTVFEYNDTEGKRKQTVRNTGSATFSYTTGQQVELYVVPNAVFDDVYDRSDHAPLYMAGIFTLLGIAMVWFTGDVMNALGASVVSIIIGLVVLVVRIVMEKSAAPTKTTTRLADHELDPALAVPIEELPRQ